MWPIVSRYELAAGMQFKGFNVRNNEKYSSIYFLQHILKHVEIKLNFVYVCILYITTPSGTLSCLVKSWYILLIRTSYICINHQESLIIYRMLHITPRSITGAPRTGPSPPHTNVFKNLHPYILCG